MSNNSDKSPMAERIEERMDDLGIKYINEVAEKSGVNRSVVSNILGNPKKSVRIDTAIAIAQGLGCHLVWFLTGEGPKTNAEAFKQQVFKASSPVMQLSELNSDNLGEVIEQAADDQSRERYSCPNGNNNNTIAIKLDHEIDGFDKGGILFFDVGESQVKTGKLVIAKTTKETPPEIMMFSSAHGRRFLKSLSSDIPDDLRIIQMDDNMQIIGAFMAYSII